MRRGRERAVQGTQDGNTDAWGAEAEPKAWLVFLNWTPTFSSLQQLPGFTL